MIIDIADEDYRASRLAAPGRELRRRASLLCRSRLSRTLCITVTRGVDATARLRGRRRRVAVVAVDAA